MVAPSLLGLRSPKPLGVTAAVATGPWNPRLVEPTGDSSLPPLRTSMVLGFARDAYVDPMGLWGTSR